VGEVLEEVFLHRDFERVHGRLVEAEGGREFGEDLALLGGDLAVGVGEQDGGLGEQEAQLGGVEDEGESGRGDRRLLALQIRQQAMAGAGVIQKEAMRPASRS